MDWLDQFFPALNFNFRTEWPWVLVLLIIIAFIAVSAYFILTNRDELI